ncbi:5-methyltetrahydropteroyltriglutamate--homocysteine S-methyltransferase [uncultured Draconibacterium sp.]|uniref:5-methyltetrahydropteroyltriglutamate-- homocysteine S-methyltransferase n=1 Tax=uncultured Draconibacterium sp. TaxID=1573823 RepID=UPI0029C82259|nr:5-methyltetrahydropteroyltriglutamate--homocysteine S-methyltransferase [uncultured Draconibacterium sp.]
MLTQNLGFPRIGAQRELKRACEKFWKGISTLEELQETGRQERLKNWKFQQDSGIDIIPSNDFSFYDQVADHIFMFGAIPSRFNKLSSKLKNIDLYFAMCRGYQKDGFDVTPLEMTKWFDTNYHYLVPEFEKNQQFKLNSNKVIDEFNEALKAGIKTKPVLLGPFSFLKLGKEKSTDFNRLDLIHALLPVYIELIGQMENTGIDCIQIDEPCLSGDLSHPEQQLFRAVLTELFGSFPSIKFILTSYFDGIEKQIEWVKCLPLEVLHLDLVRAPKQLDLFLEKIPKFLTLSLGLVDGRNIWANNLQESLEIIQKTAEKIGTDRIILAPSCSLLHVPYNLENENDETNLPLFVKKKMAFAFQKINELVLLKELASDKPSEQVQKKLKNNTLVFKNWSENPAINNSKVREQVSEVQNKWSEIDRKSDFNERIRKQQKKLNLPPFPTTMIGSLPQTTEVRKMRRNFINGDVSKKKYNEFIEAAIKNAVNWQEEVGIDVLVHGEFERNDMVEFFGEQLEGFARTQNGWVQSYGSRGVKPPIIFGDVFRKTPMTVDISKLAQSFTAKPMKGMLTGPVTILQWSFVRNDQSRKNTTIQLGLVIRDEVLNLEKAGLPIIQIDEPALREGLPIKKENQTDYLNWAVKCFKLCSWGVKDETQIHTHMCYAEFNDIIQSLEIFAGKKHLGKS